ncbi:hypothetical protein C8R43DRAFT_945606 [Mycena crocata]|nr:hypothetical protein C8R43DRAFT_945606 [Mycena crocata]
MPPTDELNPRFPLELEREIFEVAAQEDLSSIPHLLLVAHRVEIWTEPVLYRTLIVIRRFVEVVDTLHPPAIPPKTLLQLLNVRPASFFHEHVRNLFFGGDATRMSASSTSAILSSSLFAAMAPRRLYVLSLLGNLHSADFDSSQQLFSRLTHLCLDCFDFPHDSADLAVLPCLTHLAVNNHMELERLNCTYLEAALAGCAGLTVLVVVHFDEGDEDTELSARFAHDPRVVQLLVYDIEEDWKSGATGGEDCWIRADSIIRERQLRKTTGSNGLLLHSMNSNSWNGSFSWGSIREKYSMRLTVPSAGAGGNGSSIEAMLLRLRLRGRLLDVGSRLPFGAIFGIAQAKDNQPVKPQRSLRVRLLLRVVAEDLDEVEIDGMMTVGKSNICIGDGDMFILDLNLTMPSALERR